MPQINAVGRYDVVLSHLQFSKSENDKVYVSMMGTTPTGDSMTGFLFFSETMVNSRGKGSDQITLAQKSINTLVELGLDVAKWATGQYAAAVAPCNGAHASFQVQEEKDRETGEIIPGKFRVAFINPATPAASDEAVKQAFSMLKFVLPTTSKTRAPATAVAAPAAAPAFPGADDGAF